MKSFWIIAVLAFLVLINIFWLVQLDRMDSKVKYHATHLCELNRLLSLKKLLPVGTASNKLHELCNSGTLVCREDNGLVFITLKNVASCPESGRPYCGFVAKLENDVIVGIDAGYPCH